MLKISNNAQAMELKNSTDKMHNKKEIIYTRIRDKLKDNMLNSIKVK